MSGERQSRSRERQRQYDDREWEEQKERFRDFYIGKNKTLKEAAQYMKDTHNFDASLRQWERRISPAHWNFTKYVSKDARIKQVERSGRSLHEISAPGRRPVVRKNGILQPLVNEDRNLRRFARRHLNSSPSGRPRAHSLGDINFSRSNSRESSASQDDLDDDADEPVDDLVYNVGMPDVATMQALNSGVPPNVLNLPATRAMMDSGNSVQMHVFRPMDEASASVPQLMLSLPDDVMNQIPLVSGMPGFVDEQGFAALGGTQGLNQFSSPSSADGMNMSFDLAMANTAASDHYQAHEEARDMPWSRTNDAFGGEANHNIAQSSFNFTQDHNQGANTQTFENNTSFNTSAAVDFNMPAINNVPAIIAPPDVMHSPYNNDIAEQMVDPLLAYFQTSADTYATIVQDEVQRLIVHTPGLPNNSKQDLLSKLLSSLNLRRNLFVGDMTSVIDGHTKAQQRNTQAALTRFRQRNAVLESVLRYRGIDINSTLAEMRQPLPPQTDPTLTFYDDMASENI